MNDLKSIAEKIKSATRIMITGHIMPDGDSIGSVLALGIALEGMGKEVKMLSPDPLPQVFEFLPGVERVIEGCDGDFSGCKNFNRYDLLVALDCSVANRMGRWWKKFDKLVVINIDHHFDTEMFGDYNYVDSHASATGEIVFELIKLLGVQITCDIATCLYTAILTDTGSFRYDNTTQKTHLVAAELIECGVQAANICHKIYDEKPLENLRMLEAALKTLQVSDCGKVSWATIDNNVHRKLGAREENAEGIVGVVREIRGVEVAIFFYEKEPGKIKVSLRTKYKVRANEIAALFGGGGHEKAAGCLIEGNSEDVSKSVVEAALKAVHSKDAGT